MSCVSTGLIVGGGIAGLSAAIALARAGVDCDVVELADGPLGASLALSGRAAEALGELGIYEECYETGRPFTHGTTASSLNDSAGRLISAGPKRPEWPGAKTALGLFRPTLLQIMIQTAEKLGVTIRRGLTTTAIENDQDASMVTFTDGTQRRYDFSVAADGVSSRTRTHIMPDAPKPAYTGQMSIRWMVPGPPIDGEGWYMGPIGKIGFYYLPGGGIYVPAVVPSAEPKRLSDAEVHSLFCQLLDSFTAPAVRELRERLTPQSELVCRPFESLLLPDPWYRGRTLVIGDAAHATSAHMGMGGGMAVEDGVVLGQCIAAAQTVQEAFTAFMARRFERVRTVVQTSVALSKLEQAKAPPSQTVALLSSAFATLAQPY